MTDQKHIETKRAEKQEESNRRDAELAVAAYAAVYYGDGE